MMRKPFSLSMWQRKINFAVLLLLSVLTTACSIPYKIDIEQGNVITKKDIANLSIGMSKDDVQLAIGDPLLNDTFHKNRWDYVQYYKNGRTSDIQRGLVSLYFTNGLLSKIDAKQITEINTEPVPYGKD